MAENVLRSFRSVKAYVRGKTREASAERKRLTALVCAAVCAAAAIIYFAAFGGVAEREYMGETGAAAETARSFRLTLWHLSRHLTARSPRAAAQTYFDAFAASDDEKYIAVMPPFLKEERALLFDNEAEFYESYRSQFEDEREYYSAVYGSDFAISYAVTNERAYDEIAGENGVSQAEILEVKAYIDGKKLHRELKGTLTAVKCGEGWYIYESDFKEAFW